MTDSIEHILKTVSNAARKPGMFASGEKILAAVSGGADSMCMLDVLHSLSVEFGFSVAVAHLNHSTRGAESDGDEEFVKDAAKKYGLEFFGGKIGDDVELPAAHGSLEDQLRRARREFLLRTAEQCGAARIALAHNRDDQAETVLMRIIRGASPAGLAAIRPVNGNIIRPLLEISRADIEGYCGDKNIEFRTDSSNADQRFLRNKIRHSLIPALEKEFNPALRDRLVSLAEMAAEDAAFMDGSVEKAEAHCVVSKSDNLIELSIEELRSQPTAIMKRILRNAAIEALGEYAWMLERGHIESMAALVDSDGAGASSSLPRDMAATRKYETLEIGPAKAGSQAQAFQPITFKIGALPFEVDIPGSGRKMIFDVKPFSEDMLKNEDMNVAYFDESMKDKELTIRPRMDGDVFHALGAPGPKKLKDFLIDEKVDRDLRDSIPLLICDDQIAWVPGLRTSHKHRIVNSIAASKSIRIILQSIVLLIVVLLGATNSFADTAYIVKADKVNLRTGPSLNSLAFSSLNAGHCVMGTDEIRYNYQNDWIYLSHPKGWMSLKYLVKSTECAEIYDIVDTVFDLHQNVCEANDSSDYPSSKSAESYDYEVSLLKNSVTIDGWCDQEYDNISFSKTDETVLKYRFEGPRCYKPGTKEDLCVQGLIKSFKEDSQEYAVLPRCETAKDAFFKYIAVRKDGDKYVLYHGEFNCCGHIIYSFEKTDVTWKISKISLACD